MANRKASLNRLPFYAQKQPDVKLSVDVDQPGRALRGINALWTTVARELGRAAHPRRSTSLKRIANASLDATLGILTEAIEGSYTSSR